jgi:hypothetical protein
LARVTPKALSLAGFRRQNIDALNKTKPIHKRMEKDRTVVYAALFLSDAVNFSHSRFGRPFAPTSVQKLPNLLLEGANSPC